jgi:uncharacterized phage protein gp47/JayE
MANSGLTESGFTPKTFSEIKTSIYSDIADKFGSINTNDESNIAQITTVFTAKLAEPWLALNEVFNSIFVDTAKGIHLDNLALMRGIFRLQATNTIVLATITGTNQVFIPKGSQISGFGINSVFALNEDVTLSNTVCYKLLIEVTDTTLDQYKLIIENNEFVYERQQDDNKHDIITGLITLINNSSLEVEAKTSGDYLLVETTSNEPFNDNYIDDGLSINLVTTKAYFTALDSGFIPTPAKSLNTIVTPVNGWLEVINETSGDVGRNLENDLELKRRIYSSFDATGTATVSAIRSRLRNVKGVRSVTINENYTNTQQGDLPPKSVECVVLGGTDNDIANTIWLAKGAGIEYVGNTSVNIIDSEGVYQLIKFSRPVNLYIYVKVVLALTDGSIYPADGDVKIKQAIVDQISKLNLSDDVIYQSFYASVYNVPGIISAAISIGGTLIESSIPSLSANNINVLSSQIAVSDLSKITIEIT